MALTKNKHTLLHGSRTAVVINSTQIVLLVIKDAKFFRQNLIKYYTW